MPPLRRRARAFCLFLPPLRRQSWPLGVVRLPLSAIREAAPSHARPGTRAPFRASSRAASLAGLAAGIRAGSSPPSLGSQRRGKPPRGCNQDAKFGCRCGCCRSLLRCALHHRATPHQVLHLCAKWCSRLSWPPLHAPASPPQRPSKRQGESGACCHHQATSLPARPPPRRLFHCT